jgi:uncharacterized protein (DUF427 family)
MIEKQMNIKTYPTRTGKEVGFEPSPKRVRVRFGGEYIADSKRAHLLLPGGPPIYYFPREDVRMDFLELSNHREHSELLGDATYWNVKSGNRIEANAA